MLLLIYMIMVSAISYSQQVYNPASEDSVILSHVHRMPEFPGGETKLMRYMLILTQRLQMDSLKFEDLNSSRIVMRLAIDTSGRVSDVCVKRSIHPAIDAQIVRMVCEMPPFSPARDKDGRPAKSIIYLPIQLEFREK